MCHTRGFSYCIVNELSVYGLSNLLCVAVFELGSTSFATQGARVSRVVIELTGLFSAAGSLFIVAAGLTLVFGAMRVINLSHGSFYMYGAFLTSTLVGTSTGSRFWLAIVVASLGVAVLGGVVGLGVIRFVVNRDPLTQLLATFAVFLILADLALHIWGTGYRAVPLPKSLSGHIAVAGTTIPSFDIFVVGVSVVVGFGLWALLRHTQWGWRIRAAVDDPEVLEAGGVNLRRLQTSVFVLGSLLAGFGGAIVTPQISVAPGIDESIIVSAFLVAVIGGLGSVLGTAVGALIIAAAETLGALLLPTWASSFTYVAVILVLALRPSGLFGLAER